MKTQNHHQRLARRPKTFRRLTGITPEKFTELLQKLTSLYAKWDKNRLNKRTRRRKPGGGMKYQLCLGEKLLLLLIRYRTYATHEFLGWIFHLDESNIGRNYKPLEPLLAQIFKIPERRIQISEDEILELFFDGTEQEKERPSSKQRRFYSGKKKRHTVKHQIVVVKKRKPPGKGKKKRKLRIAAVSKVYAGKVHDKEIYDRSRVYSDQPIKRLGDSGYQGTNLVIPRKKPRGGELSKKDKRFNRKLSSNRVCVEHGIGKMKIWRVLKDRFRHGVLDHTLITKNVAGLHNMMFA